MYDKSKVEKTVKVVRLIKDELANLFDVMAANQDMIVDTVLKAEPKSMAFGVGRLAIGFEFEPDSNDLSIHVIDTVNKVSPFQIQFTGSGKLYGSKEQISAVFCQFISTLTEDPTYIQDAAEMYVSRGINFVPKEEIN